MNNQQKEELKINVRRMKEFAQCILTECEKWKDKEENIFKYGYAEEKLNLLNIYLKEGKELTK